MAGRLSNIHFTKCSDLEVVDVFSELASWGIIPLLAMAEAMEQEGVDHLFVNEIIGKLEDLQEAFERLRDQWEEARVKPARPKPKKGGEKLLARLGAGMATLEA